MVKGLKAALRNTEIQAVLLQVAAATALTAALAFLLMNALDALARLGISTGFGFLGQPAGFGIGESLLAYAPTDTYLRAFAAGLLNTLKVAAAGVILATIVGVAAGLGRLSQNLFVNGVSTLYVQVFRNTPQLLQIMAWYAAVTNLPRPRQALEPLPGLFLSNRGILLPGLRFDPSTWIAFDPPHLQGLTFRGGIAVSPEFTALLLGLGLYIGAFLAEIVRAGVLSVPRGEIDAAAALGLRPHQVIRLVTLPQALRLMIPPATGQYVSLVKNSSLAVAIGYPDLVNIGNTIINQTGQVVEGLAMITAVYITISLLVATLMNQYNRTVMSRLVPS